MREARGYIPMTSEQYQLFLAWLRAMRPITRPSSEASRP